MKAEEEGSQRRAIEIGMFFFMISAIEWENYHSAAVVDAVCCRAPSMFQGHIRS